MGVDFVMPVPMIFIGMLFLLVMPMRIERAALARGERLQTFRIDQFDGLAAADRRDRFFKEGLDLLADPEDQIGILQGGRLRRFQAVGVRRPRAVDDQRRLAGTLHHRGDQRMNWLDRGDDIDLGMRGKGGGAERGGGKQKCPIAFHLVSLGSIAD